VPEFRHAALLPGLLPGLTSSGDKPATCETQIVKPFAPWGDRAN
jgi:hypothetical protein